MFQCQVSRPWSVHSRVKKHEKVEHILHFFHLPPSYWQTGSASFFHSHPQILPNPFKSFTMTGISPPPTTTNKDTTAILVGSSLTTSLLPLVDITTSANLHSSLLPPDPQNTSIDNLCTTTPVIPNSNLIQFTSAFELFSPNSQNQALNLINNSSLSTLPSKILFSTSNELPALPSSTDFSYGIHPFIIALTKNKVYIPLTLFTSHSTRKLHTETTSLKQNTIYNSSSTKCHILNLSQFLEESKMDTID